MQVNWMRDGLAGITYLEGPAKGGSSVVRVEELQLDQPAPPCDDLRAVPTEELLARLKALRASRRADSQPAPPKPRERTKARDTDAAALIASLTPEQARALLAQLGLVGGADRE